MPGSGEQVARRRAFDDNDVVDASRGGGDQGYRAPGLDGPADAGAAGAGWIQGAPEGVIQQVLAPLFLQAAEAEREHAEEGGEGAGHHDQGQGGDDEARDGGPGATHRPGPTATTGVEIDFRGGLGDIHVYVEVVPGRRPGDHHRPSRRPNRYRAGTMSVPSKARPRTRAMGRPSVHRPWSPLA